MKTMNLKKMMWLTLGALLQVAAIVLGRAATELTLAASAPGRIVLHVLCARRDHHFRWHWQGVVREFVKA